MCLRSQVQTTLWNKWSFQINGEPHTSITCSLHSVCSFSLYLGLSPAPPVADALPCKHGALWFPCIAPGFTYWRGKTPTAELTAAHSTPSPAGSRTLPCLSSFLNLTFKAKRRTHKTQTAWDLTVHLLFKTPCLNVHPVRTPELQEGAHPRSHSRWKYRIRSSQEDLSTQALILTAAFSWP